VTRKSFRSYVTYRLELVSRVARETADDIYRRECGFDIRELRVLRTLAEQPDITVAEIVEATMFERTMVSRIISRLVRSGMLHRRICELDARQVRLSATPGGLAVVTRANTLGDELNEDLLAVLTPDERSCFDRALGKLTTWQPRHRAAPPRPRGEEEAPR
jgi:DNA-binding MarR family transcriptional regulator